MQREFGSLLEISDKFITKLNVFSYMILQFRLKTVWKIVSQKLGMKLLEMGKDNEDKA